MDDLISRQAAIEALNEVSEHYTEKGREWHPHISFMIDAIKELPSAQTERNEGTWIRKSNWMWTCSCCGKDNAYAYAADDAYEPTVLQDFFCPNCGAKMIKG